MEDVIGGYTSTALFAEFLADWETILARRVDEAAAVFHTVRGLHGLILAGGLGRGAPWPLSDIDLIPIYADAHTDAAVAEIEALRLPLLERWIAEGWWSGLDIGRLRFTTSEVRLALQGDTTLSSLLANDRWYHTLDKAYGGRALIDANGLTAELAAWLTARRFAPEVVEYRLQREHQEMLAAHHAFVVTVQSGDMLAATGHLRNAMKWLMTWQLERWGKRDNSLGRLGTRFMTAAIAHGDEELVTTVHALSDLTEPQVWQRLVVAPSWVHERHDRSYRARTQVGELITPLDDARDTLRVCSLYGLRRETSSPYPNWLAVLDGETVRERESALETISQRL